MSPNSDQALPKQKRVYLRILGYAARYKWRFLLGALLSLFVSVFNALSLTALKPIFDVIETGGNKPFQLHFDKDEVAYAKSGPLRKDLQVLLAKHPSPEFFDKERDYFAKVEALPADDIRGKIRYFLAEKKTNLNLFLLQYHAMKVLMFVAFLVLPIYLLKLLCDLGTVYFMSSTGLRAVNNIRDDLYHKLLDLPMSFFVKEKTGVMMSRIINDANLLSDSASDYLRVSINNFFIITTHLVLLSLISFKLLIITVIGVPLVLWPVNHYARKIKDITQREQTSLADLTGHMQEVISGIRIIRAFGMEKFEHAQFSHINESLFRQIFKFRMNNALSPALVEFTTSLLIIGLIVYGAARIIDGEFTSGSFFLFLFTLMVIISPIKQIASWYNMVQRATAAGERIFSLIDTPNDVSEAAHAKPFDVLRKNIRFQGVNFHYPQTEAQVLRNISFDVPVGSRVALVGHSGAGKSTLVDLIPRFYDVTEGKITFDGEDVRDLRIADLRRAIGVVTQEIFLFNGTVRQNISYGRDDIAQEQIEHAAEMAYADVFIKNLPQRYDTQIGERGLMLSGGQRQRLSIARAILKDPQVLILDEATSALDTESERLVQKALEKLMKNRTVFVIAHRLSTIYNADQILVMNKGRIVERGTHKELIRKKGHYKKLYDMQFRE
ncbi:MAG TPA: ABC transporter ATP-binding protein [Turneriella sp.]|nr:ABC transporter ATP-binding protein [Turneriella sp.]